MEALIVFFLSLWPQRALMGSGCGLPHPLVDYLYNARKARCAQDKTFSSLSLSSFLALLRRFRSPQAASRAHLYLCLLISELSFIPNSRGCCYAS